MLEVARIKSVRTGETYIVRWNGESSFTCTCPHYIYRLRFSKQKCKHILLTINLFGKDWFKFTAYRGAIAEVDMAEMEVLA